MAKAKTPEDPSNPLLQPGTSHFPSKAGAEPEPFPPGISIRSSRGVQIDFMFEGRRCTETLKGPPTVKLVRQAIVKRQGVLLDIQYNRFSYEQAFPDSRRIQKATETAKGVQVEKPRTSMRELFSDFIRTYMAENPAATNTLHTHKEVIRSRLAPVFSDQSPAELTQDVLIKFRQDLRDAGLSDKRISNVLTPLRGAMAIALERGLINENPFDRMRPTTRRRSVQIELDTDGLPKFDEALPSSLDPKYQNAAKQADPLDQTERANVLDAMTGQVRNFFLFAFWTGLRTGELIALRWCDVDWQNNRVCVRLSWSKAAFTNTKGKRSRWVELTEPARLSLTAQKAVTGDLGRWVFHNPRTKDRWQNSERVRQFWIAALQAAGVRYRKPYQTRHTYASAMVSAGEVPEWVADQMGHLDTRMVAEVYARWVRRPDMTPGESAAKIYANEWARAATWADSTDAAPLGPDMNIASSNEDDEAEDDEGDDDDY
jgi:integrase